MNLVKRYVERITESKRVIADRKEELKTKTINDGQTMKRLLAHPDFQYFINLLNEAQLPLLNKMLDYKYSESRDLIIARINQIQDVVKLPSQLVKRMENLPIFVKAKKENGRKK